MTDFNTRIVIDGNDGTGKTTLVRSLRLLGFRNVLDRGEMTKATDDPTVQPVPGTIYILLVCKVGQSYRRLIEAGRDMSDPYHQPEALVKYHKIFQEIAPKFDALEVLSADGDPSFALSFVLYNLDVPIRIGMPTGRLWFEHPAQHLLSPAYRQIVCHSAMAPVTGVYIRSKTYPQMVALGTLDVAVVGSDALEGNPWADACEVIERRPQGGTRMCLAARNPEVLTAKPLLRVATPYPEWAAKVFGDMGRPCTIFPVAGGTEALVADGIADVLFDVVETGDTLEANGLVVLQELGGLDVCVIRKRT